MPLCALFTRSKLTFVTFFKLQGQLFVILMTISPSSRHWSKQNQVFQLILPTHIEKQTKMHGYGVYKALLICKIGDPESGV